MNKLMFAIASIVDANTGQGFDVRNPYLFSAAAERRGREIRAKSVLAAIEALKSATVDLLQAVRQRRQLRREFADLSRLDDRLLRDIGLDRGDLAAVELGIVSYDALLRDWEEARRGEPAPDESAIAGSRVEIELPAANEADYRPTKCA